MLAWESAFRHPALSLDMQQLHQSTHRNQKLYSTFLSFKISIIYQNHAIIPLQLFECLNFQCQASGGTELKLLEPLHFRPPLKVINRRREAAHSYLLLTPFQLYRQDLKHAVLLLDHKFERQTKLRHIMA